MVLGQFSLGIGSLIQFLPIFGTAIKLVGGLLAGFGATALIVIAIIIAIFIGMFIAWKENFLGMKQIVANLWAGIKQIFGGIFKVITGIVKLIVAIFKGDWDGALEAVKKIFSGFKDFVVGIIKATVFAIAAIAIGIIRVFKFIVDRVVGFFKWLYNKIVGRSIIPDMIKAIIAWFWTLPKAVFTMFKSIVTGMFNIGKDLMQKMIDGIKSLGRKVINAILNLFPSWMRKGIEASGKITINIIKSVTEKLKKVVSRRRNDFIWRPGQAPIDINPKDTLIGFKGSPPNLGGGGGGGIVQENHFHGFTMDELNRELDNRDRRLVDDIRRLVKE